MSYKIRNAETFDHWIDLSALTEGEIEEFHQLSDPAIVRDFGEFARGTLDSRWIELYLKAAKARLDVSRPRPSRPNA